MMAKLNTKGFTLLEIMAGVLIIGVLAALALPRISLSIESNIAREGEQILLALWGSQKRYYMDNSVYATNLSQLDIDIPTSQNFQNLQILNNPSQIASLDRIDRPYSFAIDENGTITCSQSVGPGMPDYCAIFGY